MLVLYDAPRCPYCARVRIVIAEKGIAVETVTVDLDDRPAWIYEKNPLGKVPVLEGDGLCLPESAVVMEYLEDRFPEPPLLPDDLEQRALARLAIFRFDRFSDAYYALRRGHERARSELGARLAELDSVVARDGYLTGSAYGLADIAYLPWIVRARRNLGVELDEHPALAEWFERLSARPAVAAELELVGALR
ncbi:MAG TPA: glutathione S-transferase family protein [Gaiellaceae bacterium]